jgi:hypothetical protein
MQMECCGEIVSTRFIRNQSRNTNAKNQGESTYVGGGEICCDAGMDGWSWFVIDVIGMGYIMGFPCNDNE